MAGAGTGSARRGWRRHANQAAAALLLFASGVAFEAALRGGLYANAVLAGLVAVRLSELLLRRPAPAAAVPDRQGPDDAFLQAELRRLRFMLDQVPAPLVAVSAAGVVEVVNRAARALFRTDGRVGGEAAVLREAIAAGNRTVLKLTGRTATGDIIADPAPERSYALSVASWSSAEGPALLAVLVDIQAELQAAEAAGLREVLQTLSHEVMNALTPVTSLAETALALLGADDAAAPMPDVTDALETIARRVRGMDRFVQGYRALARVPPAICRPASVSALLDEAALLFRSRWHGAGVALTLRRPSPDIVAQMDAELLGQALTALLTNAAEAALAAPERPPAVMLTAGYDAPYVCIRVADSGQGIDPARKALMFRPLFTTKPGGTGIGLGIARQIALSHGGELVVEDATAEGGAVLRLFF